MSIVNNALVGGFPAAENGAYQPANGAQFGASMPAAAAGDVVAAPWAPLPGGPPQGGGPWGGNPYGGNPYGNNPYGGPSSGSTGLGGFGGIMNAFMNMLSNMLNSLGCMFGGSGSPGSTTGTPIAGSLPQTYFTNASGSSVGDPHDAFNGTTAQGTNVGDAWNSMEGHADLLNSDSFNGGYRVSTTSTAPGANGVTYNATATVATDNGATNVTMNANGAYTVTENGQNVTLTQGQAVPLDAGETATLNADGSLTIADTNANGGTIDTTLSSNGNGVDVKVSASNVDLGGYLVGHTNVADGGSPSPVIFPNQAMANGAFSNPAYANALGTQTSQASGAGASLGELMQLVQANDPLG
jgi:hypothetical protein